LQYTESITSFFRPRALWQSFFWILSFLLSAFLLNACSSANEIKLDGDAETVCEDTSQTTLINQLEIIGNAENIRLMLEIDNCSADPDNFTIEHMASNGTWLTVSQFEISTRDFSNDEPIEIVWHSALDYFNRQENVQLRITPLVDNLAGEPYTSAVFLLDNRFKSSYSRLDKDIMADSPSSFPKALSNGEHTFMVWFDSRDGSSNLYASLSTDSGNSWSERDLQLDKGVKFKPFFPLATTIDKQGNFLVIWISDSLSGFAIHLNGLDTGGQQLFDTPKKLYNTADLCSNISSLTAEAVGDNLAIAFSDNRNEALQARLLLFSDDYSLLKNYDLGQQENSYGEEISIALLAEQNTLHTAFRRDSDGCFLIYRKFTEQGQMAHSEREVAAYSASDPTIDETLHCNLNPEFFMLQDAAGLIFLSPLSNQRKFISYKIEDDQTFSRLPDISDERALPTLSLDHCQNSSGQTLFVWSDAREENIYSIYSQLVNQDGSLAGLNTRLDLSAETDVMSYSPKVACGKDVASVVFMDYDFDLQQYALKASSISYLQGTSNANIITNGEALANPTNSYSTLSTRSGFTAFWHDYHNTVRAINLANSTNGSDYSDFTNRLPASDNLVNSHATSPAFATGYNSFLTTWHSNTLSGNRLFYRQNTDSNWVEPIELNIENISTSSIAYDMSNSAHLLYSTESAIYISRFTEDGLSENTRINPNDQSEFSYKHPSLITFKDNNNLLVLWRDIREGIVNLYARLYSEELGWGQEFNINDKRGPGGTEVSVLSYQYSLSDSGNVAIAFMGSSGGSVALYTRMLNQYGSSLQERSNNIFRSNNGQIDFSLDYSDNGNYIGLVFTAPYETSDSNMLYFSHSEDAGDSFFGVVPLMKEGGAFSKPLVSFGNLNELSLLWWQSDQDNSVLSLHSSFTPDMGYSFSDHQRLLTVDNTKATALPLQSCINKAGKSVALVQKLSGTSYVLELLTSNSAGFEWQGSMQLNPSDTFAGQADLHCNENGSFDIIYGITTNQYQTIAYSHLPSANLQD